jgi:hypothetical protein
MKEELLFESVKRLDRVETECGRLDDKITEAEAARLWIATQLEARVSPDPERLKLLAAAFAGYFVPDVSRDDRNRAFRVALQMEPTDAVWLQRYVGEPGATYQGDEQTTEATRRRALIAEYPTIADSMIALGCILDRYHDAGRARGFPEVERLHVTGVPTITRIGATVIQLLRTHQMDRARDAPREL